MELPNIAISKEEIKVVILLVTLYILGVAVGLTHLLDFFQKLGWIKEGDENEPGTTGFWNKLLSFVITVATFVAVHLGAGAGVESVIQAGAEAATLLLASGILALLTWFAHQIMMIIDGAKRKANPQPTAKVTVETSGGATATAQAQAQPAASTEVYRDNTVVDTSLIRGYTENDKVSEPRG